MIQGYGFDSWSGCIPGLRVRSLLGCVRSWVQVPQEVTSPCFSLSLPLSLESNEIMSLVRIKKEGLEFFIKLLCESLPLSVPKIYEL